MRGAIGRCGRDVIVATECDVNQFRLRGSESGVSPEQIQGWRSDHDCAEKLIINKPSVVILNHEGKRKLRLWIKGTTGRRVPSVSWDALRT